MRRYSKLDLFRYAGNASFKSFLKTFFEEPGYRYIFFYRLARAYRKIPVMGIIARLLLRRCSHRFGIQVPFVTNIGEGLYIGHFGLLIINEGTVIGRNCNLAPGVTIGQVNRGPRQGCPTLGDSVWIGGNAIVVGKISIGDNVLIAPNAYVNFDVPPNSIVIGNPAVIKPREDATEGYIENKI
ncbi:MAG: serine acetyltransferase [Bacteroidota bacterium]|nr:serine acetyltransferase [Bacteroidota bacterium]